MIPRLHDSLRILAALAVTVSLAACATTSSTPTPVAGNGVEVLYSPPTDREYVELGLVNTQTGQTIFHDRSVDGMIAKLRAEAAKLGADAIIVREANQGTWGVKGGGNTGFERGNAQAVAIRFK